jgi:hypothetical protein
VEILADDGHRSNRISVFEDFLLRLTRKRQIQTLFDFYHHTPYAHKKIASTPLA